LIKKTEGKVEAEDIDAIIPKIPKAQELVEANDVIYIIGKNKDVITFSNSINKSKE
jgi:Trk K+ transport system NAD-binding subunit